MKDWIEEWCKNAPVFSDVELEEMLEAQERYDEDRDRLKLEELKKHGEMR